MTSLLRLFLHPWLIHSNDIYGVDGPWESKTNLKFRMA